MIVAQTQNEVDQLKQELESTKAAFAAPAATIASLELKLSETSAALDTSAARVAELTEENKDYEERHGQYKYSLPFKWVGGAMFVCLLAGFLIGLWWIDLRSRKRHGGIRIY